MQLKKMAMHIQCSSKKMQKHVIFSINIMINIIIFSINIIPLILLYFAFVYFFIGFLSQVVRQTRWLAGPATVVGLFGSLSNEPLDNEPNKPATVAKPELAESKMDQPKTFIIIPRSDLTN